MSNVYRDAQAAEAYAATRSGLGPGLLQALVRVQQAIKTPVTAIVDVGSGSGRLSGHLADRFAATVVGVEPSAAMRAEAERRHRDDARVSFRDGRGEALPLDSGSAELVMASLCFHFLTDRPRAMAEMARVLRPGGHLAIWNPTRDTMSRDGLHRFFPETQASDDARMPLLADIENAAAHVRLQRVVVEPFHAPAAKDAATLMEQVRQRAFSSLRLINDDAFARGLAAMTAYFEDGGAMPQNVTTLLLYRKPDGETP